MSFTIAYVPNVENVDNVEFVKLVDEVRKLPHPYFPNPEYTYNFQPGGRIHVTTQNTYQAVYTPTNPCELRLITLCASAYNVEDTYDVLVGSRYVIKNSNVKEMAELRKMEVFEVVDAGTPIIINFHNNSGYEKHLFYDFSLLLSEEVINYPENFTWNFEWSDPVINVTPEDTATLVITQPDYVNMDSDVSTFDLVIKDLTLDVTVATISCDVNGVITSDYIENDPLYTALGLLGRVNVIGITDVQRFNKSIHVTMKNLDDLVSHPIELSINGTVENIINGG